MIFQASAGAGKTHTLVERYLLLALAPQRSFRSILAITFTNLATQEMKNRLLERLHDIARSSPQEMPQKTHAEPLAQALKMDYAQLAQRAGQVLRDILHAYGAFSVSTIDSFNNRLVRSFSRDLGLSSQFEVTLEPQPLLETAVDDLLEQLTPQHPLTPWLRAFGRERLEQGKRASYRQLLVEAAEDLLKETTLPYLVKLEGWELANFQQIAKKLQKDYANKLSIFNREAAALQNYLQENDLYPDYFSRKFLPNWVQSWTQGVGESPNPTLQKQIAGEADFFAKSKPGARKALEPHQDVLRQKASALLERIRREGPFLYLKPELDQSLYHTAVMQALEQQLQEVIERSQQVPISRFTRLISEHLRYEPAPYLYERLGDRYRFFFIDEFQDTSRLQWENLVPLINESLSQDPAHKAMIVGDVKQAIYRFRGGDVQQFVDLIQDRDTSHLAPGAQIPLYERRTEVMQKNWRSRPELVEFNNKLFPFLSEQLQAEPLREVYGQARQKPQCRQPGGYVHLAWLSKEGGVEAYRLRAVQKTLQHLSWLRKRGCRWGDMAILCQQHKQILLLSEHLRDWKDPLTAEAVPVNSDRDQTLENALALRGLIAFYRARQEPLLKEPRLPWAEWLYRQLTPEEDPGSFLTERSQEKAHQTLAFLDQHFADWHSGHFQNLGLLEQLHYLLHFVQPAYRQDPLILRFLDEVALLRERDRADATSLLRWWEEAGHKIKVPAAATDALRLLTLHAAKGLEFPVVIMPFVGDSAQGNQKKWAWEDIPSGTEAGDLPAARMAHTDTLKAKLPAEHWLAQRIEHFQQMEELDALNRFYVGCTRPKQELHLFAQAPAPDKPPSKLIRHLPGFLQLFAEKEDCLHAVADPPEAHWGTPIQFDPKREQAAPLTPLPPYTIRPWRQRLKVSDAAPEVWHAVAEGDARQTGLKLHRLLASINSADDLEVPLERAYRMVEFQKEELKPLRVYLQALLQDPRLAFFFAPGGEVLTERAILLPGGGQKIPDRLVWQGGQVHLLDYKTGQAEAAHQEQVREYAHQLQEAGYEVGQCLLVYLHEPPEIAPVSV